MGLLNAADTNIDSAANQLSKEGIYKYAKAIANEEGDPETNDETNDESEKDDLLKRLSNVTKYKLNRDCLKDPFKTGRVKLKKVKEDREAELALFERKVRLLWWSVDYFRSKRKKEQTELEETQESTGFDRSEFEEWELAMIGGVLANLYLVE